MEREENKNQNEQLKITIKEAISSLNTILALVKKDSINAIHHINDLIQLLKEVIKLYGK